MWGKGYCRSGQPQAAIWRMHIAYWIPKATNTHPVHVTLIAVPLQQQLQERPSMLCHTYIECLVHMSPIEGQIFA